MVKRRKMATGSRLKVEVKEEKSPSSSGDVNSARGRLKGVLQFLMEQSDESSEESQDEGSSEAFLRQMGNKKIEPNMCAVRKSIKPPRKRRKRDPIKDQAYHHTYVMKLYDRSVDLAQFSENAPLYPICRAWMANQPRNTNLAPRSRTPTPEPPPITDFDGDAESDQDIRDTYKLPSPLPQPVDDHGTTHDLRIPSPVSHERGLNQNFDIKQSLSKETLLEGHLSRWSEVRKKWHNSAHLNEARYAESGRTLKSMFIKAQKSFH